MLFILHGERVEKRCYKGERGEWRDGGATFFQEKGSNSPTESALCPSICKGDAVLQNFGRLRFPFLWT